MCASYQAPSSEVAIRRTNLNECCTRSLDIMTLITILQATYTHTQTHINVIIMIIIVHDDRHYYIMTGSVFADESNGQHASIFMIAR